jgi:uncharacterized protein (DUF1778 family)
MSTSTEERGRITARVSTLVAEKLQEAADLSGATLNQFLIQAALEKADRIIDRERTLQFSAEDAAMFIAMLDGPRPPNEAMKRAYERYKNKVSDGSLRNRATPSA